MVAADSVELGSGTFRYEALATWERLPDGMTLHESPGVAVDADDLVYVLTRNTAKSPRGDSVRTYTSPFGGRGRAIRRSLAIIGPSSICAIACSMIRIDCRISSTRT